MKVRSTDFDRTLMTAQCLLVGLFPANMTSWIPSQWQPVSIHSQVFKKDHVRSLLLLSLSLCPILLSFLCSVFLLSISHSLMPPSSPFACLYLLVQLFTVNPWNKKRPPPPPPASIPTACYLTHLHFNTTQYRIK